jgi:hypothetical protein
MNPLVTKVHGKERRWSAEYAALRQLCLASGLNEELMGPSLLRFKWQQRGLNPWLQELLRFAVYEGRFA